MREGKHFHVGKFNDAEADYTEAIRMNNRFTDAWIRKGDLYFRTEKVANLLKRSLDRERKSQEGQEGFGRALGPAPGRSRFFENDGSRGIFSEFGK